MATSQAVPKSNLSAPLWDSKTISEAIGATVPDNIYSYGVSIDSRTISDNDIFIALKGDSLNGNKFALDALKKGAALAIVDEDIDSPAEYQKHIVKVKDALEALKSLAMYFRANTKAKIICVTGSVGKTSTKEMLRAAFAGCGSVYASHGNFNNHFGLPLCLANMPHNTEYGIFELGMNHAGEISYLSKMVKPDIAIITTVEPVHLEFFNYVEDIARAKAEIFDGMEAGKIAVINRNNPYHQILEDAAKAKNLKIVTFGSNADVKPASYDGKTIKADVAGTQVEYKLAAHGKQHMQNSLAVLAALYGAQSDIKKGAASLINFGLQRGRGARLENKEKEISIIDETYNASPASVAVAIENASLLKGNDNRVIVVLGDMRELGDKSIEFHINLQTPILNHNIDKVFCVGQLMKNLFDALPDELKGIHTENSGDMAKAIMPHLKQNDIVMVKGSRSMQMEKIVDEIAGIKE